MLKDFAEQKNEIIVNLLKAFTANQKTPYYKEDKIKFFADFGALVIKSIGGVPNANDSKQFCSELALKILENEE